jgi:hypothetical protein
LQDHTAASKHRFYYSHSGNGASHREELAASTASTCNALILLIKTAHFTSMVVTFVDLLAITYLNGDKRPVFCTPCGGWPNGLDCNKLTRTLAFYKV